MKLLAIFLVAVMGVVAADDWECITCKTLYTFAVDIINAEEPIEKDALMELCNKLEVSFLVTACTTFVDQYYDTVLHDGENWESQNKLCIQQTHACSSKSTKKINLQDLLTSKQSRSNQACLTCKMAVPIIVNALQGVPIEDLNKVCNAFASSPLTAPFVAECKLVMEYFVESLGQISSESPAEICSEIGLCAASDKYVLDIDNRAGPQCSLCSGAVDVLRWVLQQSWLQQQLASQVKLLCHLLPQAIQQCEQTIDQYFTQIVEFLLQDIVTDTEICVDLLGCTKQKLNLKSVSPKGNKWGVDICGLLQQLMNDVPALVTQLAGVCAAIPDPTLSSACTSAFTNNQAQIIQIVDSALQFLSQQIPFITCQLTPTRTFTVNDNIGKDSIPCTLCTDFFKDIQQMIADPNLQQQIVATIEKNCKLIPNTQYQATCKNLIDSYSSVIFSTLAGLLDPTNVCPKLSLC